MANFPLATNEFYKSKEGEEVSKTEWHEIVNLSGTFCSTVGCMRRNVGAYLPAPTGVWALLRTFCRIFSYL